MKKLHKEQLTYKETKNYYFVDVPVYKRYKTVKKPQYCNECGHQTGFDKYKVGVGLKGYIKKKYFKDDTYYLGKVLEKHIQPLIEDGIFNRLKFFENKSFFMGEKIKIPKIK